MAHRRGGRLPLVVGLALIVAACTATDAAPTTTSDGAHTTTSSSTSSTTTTTQPPTPTTTVAPLPPGEPADINAEIGVPDGEGPFPAVVLVHGGGWVTGGPGVVRPLAEPLTEEGFLTVNTRYRLASLDRAGYPRAVEDVACAVRFAASHPQSDGTVAIVGHSAGAHLSALVALKGDDHVENCELVGSGVPSRLVGLAGPYDTDRLGLAMIPFFGQSRNVNPDIWDEGNPLSHTHRNPDLDALIMYGELDGLVDDRFAFDFHEAIISSGGESLLELVEGARHADMHDPAFVGDLIVTWLER